MLLCSSSPRKWIQMVKRTLNLLRWWFLDGEFALSLWFSRYCVQFFVTPWTIAHQTPLFMGFPKKEYWSGLPFLSPVDLSDARLGPASPALAGSFFTTEPPRSPCLGLSGPKLNHKREGYKDLTVKGRDKTMEAIWRIWRCYATDFEDREKGQK